MSEDRAMQIKFEPNYQKIIEAITWISNTIENSSRYTVLKTLFYSDKFHLQKYGRPITGDTYIKMSTGPVASTANDIIKATPSLPENVLAAASEAFYVGNNPQDPILPKRNANEEWFSDTDIECLKKAIDKCRQLDFRELKEETHREPAWILAEMNKEMDFALFIDPDTPNRDNLITYIKEMSACQSV